MPETYLGVGLNKGNFYDILADYCSFHPAIDEATAGVVKLIDTAAEKAFEKKYSASEFMQVCFSPINIDLPSGTNTSLYRNTIKAQCFYYRDLFENGEAAKKLGEAQTYLAFAGAKESKNFTDKKLNLLARSLYGQVMDLCESGDQFYCGAMVALQQLSSGNSHPDGFLGQVYAPYFGTTLWKEGDTALPFEEKRKSCNSIEKQKQNFRIK